MASSYGTSLMQRCLATRCVRRGVSPTGAKTSVAVAGLAMQLGISISTNPQTHVIDRSNRWWWLASHDTSAPSCPTHQTKLDSATGADGTVTSCPHRNTNATGVCHGSTIGVACSSTGGAHQAFASQTTNARWITSRRAPPPFKPKTAATPGRPGNASAISVEPPFPRGAVARSSTDRRRSGPAEPYSSSEAS